MLSDSRDGDISAHPSGIINASQSMVPPGNIERVAAEIPQWQMILTYLYLTWTITYNWEHPHNTGLG